MTFTDETTASESLVDFFISLVKKELLLQKRCRKSFEKPRKIFGKWN